MRDDRLDLTDQRKNLADAQDALAVALRELAGDAASAYREMTAKRRPLVTPAMVPVHTAWRAVLAAEQTVQIAEDDLDAAAGRTG